MVDAFTVHAFTREGVGGNPAGVVLDAEGLDDSAMQAIATELGMSETAFVLPSQSCDLRLRFFAPSAEVRLCGHATVAGWHLLLEKGRVGAGDYTMETLAGPQSISCSGEGLETMSQNLPEFGATVPLAQVAQVLGLQRADLVPSEQMPVQIASTGLHKIFAPVRSLEAIRRIAPDLTAIEELSRSFGAIGIYCFTRETLRGATAHCRNFAPVVGIREDSATGTSAAATAS
ncbi:MAG TPA: PhzF family phenazine biosynthesis protein, partial [Deltaproteobacteria bacterium]|nr:PhzF family phenazine biosynthesis protein [Deltaproteobacteria bacterium]